MSAPFRQLIPTPLRSPKFDRALDLLLGTPRSGAARPFDESLYRARLSRDLLSRVARNLGLSRSHVCMVANNHRRSRRVEAAIKAEFDRINRSVSEFEQSISTRLTEVNL